MNVAVLAPYFGYGLMILFGGFGVWMLLTIYLQSRKNKPKVEEEKVQQSKFQSIGKKRALVVDKKDRKKTDSASLIGAVFGEKQERQGFAPQAGSASVEDISQRLNLDNSSSRRTFNPMDIPVVDEALPAEPAPVAETNFTELPELPVQRVTPATPIDGFAPPPVIKAPKQVARPLADIPDREETAPKAPMKPFLPPPNFTQIPKQD